MTNNLNSLIKVDDLTPGVRICDKAGIPYTVQRVRWINETRRRIDTVEGPTMLCNGTDCVYLD